ncbi:MAG: AAA family ATPase [Saprospiraceae bacterium]|nr:AAA family ATPase [Saprospiraceae bacterium]
MEKKFNITGKCNANRHYMADVSNKSKSVIKLVEAGEYFIINRPRQYGKTTMLHNLATALREKGDYIVFNTSFGGIGDAIFEDETVFSSGFVNVLANYAKYQVPELATWLKLASPQTTNLDILSEVITALMNETNKKVVLLIDEVDKSSNNQLFVSFLAMLREKYLMRDDVPTFHSIVLAGLHDVKTLKLKLRPDEERKYNSPWNIATDFKVDMNLFPAEIKPMLDDYCAATGVVMDTQLMADTLFYHTSGYPFLVSKLCKTIDEDILPTKLIDAKSWSLADLDESVRLLLKESNTNFDSLIKNLENDSDLYNFVYRIIMDGEIVIFNVDEPLILKGLMHGIFKDEGQIKIHNRIYEQRIYNYMVAKTTVAMKSPHNYAGHFVLENGGLDMPAVLLKFQQFMKEEFNEKDKTFLEQHGRLVFLSFLSPILNGKGHSFKEVQTSEEKRLDIITTFNQFKYIIELKRWYGEVYHKKGIKQLNDYLEIHKLHEGFLVIFEYNKTKSWHQEWIDFDGKRSLPFGFNTPSVFKHKRYIYFYCLDKIKNID